VDPFSLTFDALWNLVDSAPVFADLVLLKNRVKYNLETDRDPMKDKVSVADLPELTLVTTGVGSVNLHHSSCTSAFTRQYSWILATGDWRVNYKLFPVEFALACAMSNWRSVLSSLTWNGQTFIKRVDLTSAVNGESDSRRNRGIKGWTAIWSGEVQMVFKTSALRDYLEIESSSSSGV
jgi:hypothetical protein